MKSLLESTPQNSIVPGRRRPATSSNDMTVTKVKAAEVNQREVYGGRGRVR